MVAYEDRTITDESGITLTLHTAQQADRPGAMPLHRHRFCELVLVAQGGCEFFYYGERMFLLPGDLMLVEAEQPHACRLKAEGRLYVCHFEPWVAPDALHALAGLEQTAAALPAGVRRRLRDMYAFNEDEALTAETHGPRPGERCLRHLLGQEKERMLGLCQAIADEQDARKMGFVRMKQSYLEQILILLRRQGKQAAAGESPSSWKQEMVDQILHQIDENVAGAFDFNAFAHSQGITATYFRTVFKGIVGMPPVDYLNHVRVLKALALLQTTDLTISETAAQVGIYDANYFSRLFKKVTGYPPRYFKSIPKDPE